MLVLSLARLKLCWGVRDFVAVADLVYMQNGKKMHIRDVYIAF